MKCAIDYLIASVSAINTRSVPVRFTSRLLSRLDGAFRFPPIKPGVLYRGDTSCFPGEADDSTVQFQRRGAPCVPVRLRAVGIVITDIPKHPSVNAATET